MQICAAKNANPDLHKHVHAFLEQKGLCFAICLSLTLILTMASAGSSSVEERERPGEAQAEMALVSAPSSASRVAEPVVAVGASDIGPNTGGIRNQHVLLTYAQCEAPMEYVFRVVCHSRFVLGCAAVRETHQDGGHHIHVYLQKKRGDLSWDNVTFVWNGKSHDRTSEA